MLHIITSGVVLSLHFFSHLCSNSALKCDLAEHPEIPGHLQSRQLGTGAAKAAALTVLGSPSLKAKPAAGFWPGEDKELLRRGWRFPVRCSSSAWALLGLTMEPGVCHKMTPCQSCMGIEATSAHEPKFQKSGELRGCQFYYFFLIFFLPPALKAFQKPHFLRGCCSFCF